MTAEAEDIARRAAARLSGEFGAALPANLEAAIHGTTGAGQTFEAATVIALATLLLNIAKFAWDIRKDTRKPAAASPPPDVIARRIRLEVALPAEVTAAQRDRMISVVLEELPRA